MSDRTEPWTDADLIDLGDGGEPLPDHLVTLALQEIEQQEREDHRRAKKEEERRRKSKAAKKARRLNR